MTTTGAQKEAEELLRSLRYQSSVIAGNERKLAEHHIQAFIPAVAARLAERDGLAKAWEETAAQHCRNEFFYRGLLDQIAVHLGPNVYVSDDGSIQDSPLRLKIPEMVADLRAKLEAAEKELAGIHQRSDALIPTIDKARETIDGLRKDNAFLNDALTAALKDRDYFSDKLAAAEKRAEARYVEGLERAKAMAVVHCNHDGSIQNIPCVLQLCDELTAAIKRINVAGCSPRLRRP